MPISRRTLLATAFQTGAVLALDRRLLQAAAIGALDEVVPQVEDLPAEARPWVYWFWFNGDVSREGITADLEAMRAIGIGGAILLCTGFGSKGPVRYMSPLWFDMIRHVLTEAQRLDLSIDLNNDDGWADAGGPWIPPALAMHKLVWTETIIDGGKGFSGALIAPEAKQGFYHDVALVAFPAPDGAGEILPIPVITKTEGKPSIITHDYGKTITARSADVQLWAEPVVGDAPVTFEVQASVDGAKFETVYRFDNKWRWTAQQVSRTLSVSVHFSAATARYFRVVLPFTDRLAEPTSAGKEPRPNFQSSFRLEADDRLALWQLKGGYGYTGATLEQPEHYAGGWVDQFQEQGSPLMPEGDPAAAIAPERVIDLSSRMENGKLEWTPPEGRWILLRVGYTLVGSTNHIASKEGLGFNVNPFLEEAMDLQFKSVLQKVIDKNGEHVSKSLRAFHMDSSECGPSNWSPKLAVDFSARRGYSLTSWLPVLAGGRTVGSIGQSNRFLWDFRRTMADLMAERYWGRLARLSHEHGGLFTAEASGRMQYMSDPLLYLNQGDLPMGEFWPGEADVRPDCLNCRSVANVHGKKAVLGEAFTSASWAGSPNAGEWQDHPYSLKAFGDRAFCAGVNHYVFHRSISQPKTNEYPGLAWGPRTRHVGINMERTNTWWYPGAAWITYLARSQYLLQSGREVVDVCVLVDEGAPNRVVEPQGLPAGHRYDGLHSTVLPQVLVSNGALVMPSGMTYKVLVLPPLGRMRPETAREVARLSHAGATIAGEKPKGSPSLVNFPACDAEVLSISATWKPVYRNAGEALRALGVGPDFSCDEKVLFMHRSHAAEDRYFLSNQTGREIRIDAKFRVTGRRPELFDADTGKTTAAAIYREDRGYVTVPLLLDPAGSVFVLFRSPSQDALIAAPELVNSFGASLHDVMVRTKPRGEIEVTTARAGDLRLAESRGRKASLQLSSLPARTLEGRWKLAFPAGWGAPPQVELPRLISWSQHPDAGVRHFSGSGTYSITFNLDASELGPDRAVFLELGEVQVMAEVVLNGKAVRTLWKPPFRCEVGDALRAGANTLDIRVTNLWPNRLIGDAGLPVEKQFTKTSFNPYDPDSTLFPSGLIGPVTLSMAHRRTVRWT